jgi:gliding motility-associated-like protein
MKKNTFLATISFLLLNSFVGAQNPTFTTNGDLCTSKAITFSTPFNPPTGSVRSIHWDFGTGSLGDTVLQEIAPFAPVPFTFSQDRDYFIEVTVTSTNGTKHVGSRAIFINPTPDPIIDLAIPCFPSSIVFEDFSTVSIGTIDSRLWSIDVSTSTDQIFTYDPGVQGTFSVQIDVTSDKGCKASISEIFDYAEAPILTIIPSGTLTVCKGDSATLSASGASSFIWNIGATSSTIRVGDAGVYIVTGYEGNECSVTDSVEVVYVSKPIAYAGDDVTLKRGEKTTLQGSGGLAQSWSPIDFLSDPLNATTDASPNSTTLYILTVVDQNGCKDNDSITVTVDTETTVPIHNMITPNGDGYNDKWDLSNVPQIENSSIHVFNRWGWEVFKSEDYKHDWQGTFNNERLPDGSYVYVIQFENSNFETLRGILEILSNTQK